MRETGRFEDFAGGFAVSVAAGNGGFDACYLGYFECFNSQRYYEAHDVLEHLWLKGGREGSEYAFYKGLIQLAAGFVHLKLQHDHPDHPRHGRRLHPARRLFLRAAEHLSPYGSFHRGIDPRIPVALCNRFALLIEQSDFSLNPWSPRTAPSLFLPQQTGLVGGVSVVLEMEGNS